MYRESLKIAKGLKVIRGTVVKRQNTNLLPKKKKRK